MMHHPIDRPFQRAGALLLQSATLVAGLTTAQAAEPAAVPANRVGPAPQGRLVKMTWPEIARRFDRHPRLGWARLRVAAARSGVDAARAVPNPTLEATVGLGRSRPPDTLGAEWGISLNLPLGWAARRGSLISAAEAEVDLAAAEGGMWRRRLRLGLRTLAWHLLHDQARVRSLEALQAETEALVRIVAKRIERNDIRPAAATRVEIEREKIAIEVEAARRSLASRGAQLARWLDLPSGERPVVVGDLHALPNTERLGRSGTKPSATHPILQASRARVRAKAAELRSERMARIPAFSVALFTSQELDRQAWGVGLSIDLPLWNWNSGRIARAEAALAARRKEVEAASLDLEVASIEARAACQTSVLTASRLGTQVIPRARLAAAAAAKTYEMGDVGVLELLDARRTLLEAQRVHLRALAKAQIDCSRWESLQGEETR